MTGILGKERSCAEHGFTGKQCADTDVDHNTDLCIKCSGSGSLVFHCLVLGSIPAGNAGSGSQSVFETAQLVLSVSAFLEKIVERNEEGILHWQG